MLNEMTDTELDAYIARAIEQGKQARRLGLRDLQASIRRDVREAKAERLARTAR